MNTSQASVQTDNDLEVDADWFATTKDERSIFYWMGWRDYLCHDISDKYYGYENYAEDYEAGVADAKDYYGAD
jgi:hypothetical protein